MPGTCNSDKCPLYADLVSLNLDKTSCANNSDCTVAGYECELAPYTTFTCNASVLTATEHPGYCVEAAPGLAAAALTDTADMIKVGAL